MQALVSDDLKFHCSVLKAQVSASLLREGEVEKRDEGSFQGAGKSAKCAFSSVGRATDS